MQTTALRSGQAAGSARNLDQEIARLRIEATKDGIDRRRALLALEERQELARAKELGVSVEKIREKYGLRRAILGASEAFRTWRGGAWTSGGRSMPPLRPPWPAGTCRTRSPRPRARLPGTAAIAARGDG